MHLRILPRQGRIDSCALARCTNCINSIVVVIADLRHKLCLQNASVAHCEARYQSVSIYHGHLEAVCCASLQCEVYRRIAVYTAWATTPAPLRRSDSPLLCPRNHRCSCCSSSRKSWYVSCFRYSGRYPALWVLLPLSPGYALPTHCMRFQSLRKSHLLFQNYLCCLKRCLQRCIICRCIVVRILPVRPLRSGASNASLSGVLRRFCHRYGQFGRNAVHFFLRRVRIVQNPSAAFSASVKAFLTSSLLS